MGSAVAHRTQGERLAALETDVTSIKDSLTESRSESRAFREEYRIDQVEMQRVLGTLIDRTSRLDERTSPRRMTISAAGIATVLTAVAGFIFEHLTRR